MDVYFLPGVNQSVTFPDGTNVTNGTNDSVRKGTVDTIAVTPSPKLQGPFIR